MITVCTEFTHFVMVYDGKSVSNLVTQICFTSKCYFELKISKYNILKNNRAQIHPNSATRLELSSIRPIESMYFTRYYTRSLCIFCAQPSELWHKGNCCARAHGSTFLPAWISTYMRYKVWGEITNQLPNFNDYSWSLITDKYWIPHFIIHVIIHPCRGCSWTMLVKGTAVKQLVATSSNCSLMNNLSWKAKHAHHSGERITAMQFWL